MHRALFPPLFLVSSDVRRVWREFEEYGISPRADRSSALGFDRRLKMSLTSNPKKPLSNSAGFLQAISYCRVANKKALPRRCHWPQAFWSRLYFGCYNGQKPSKGLTRRFFLHGSGLFVNIVASTGQEVPRNFRFNAYFDLRYYFWSGLSSLFSKLKRIRGSRRQQQNCCATSWDLVRGWTNARKARHIRLKSRNQSGNHFYDFDFVDADTGAREKRVPTYSRKIAVAANALVYKAGVIKFSILC